MDHANYNYYDQEKSSHPDSDIPQPIDPSQPFFSATIVIETTGSEETNNKDFEYAAAPCLDNDNLGTRPCYRGTPMVIRTPTPRVRKASG